MELEPEDALGVLSANTAAVRELFDGLAQTWSKLPHTHRSGGVKRVPLHMLCSSLDDMGLSTGWGGGLSAALALPQRLAAKTVGPSGDVAWSQLQWAIQDAGAEVRSRQSRKLAESRNASAVGQNADASAAPVQANGHQSTEQSASSGSLPLWKRSRPRNIAAGTLAGVGISAAPLDDHSMQPTADGHHRGTERSGSDGGARAGLRVAMSPVRPVRLGGKTWGQVTHVPDAMLRHRQDASDPADGSDEDDESDFRLGDEASGGGGSTSNDHGSETEHKGQEDDTSSVKNVVGQSSGARKHSTGVKASTDVTDPSKRAQHGSGAVLSQGERALDTNHGEGVPGLERFGSDRSLKVGEALDASSAIHIVVGYDTDAGTAASGSDTFAGKFSDGWQSPSFLDHDVDDEPGRVTASRITPDDDDDDNRANTHSATALAAGHSVPSMQASSPEAGTAVRVVASPIARLLDDAAERADAAARDRQRHHAGGRRAEPTVPGHVVERRPLKQHQLLELASRELPPHPASCLDAFARDPVAWRRQLAQARLAAASSKATGGGNAEDDDVITDTLLRHTRGLRVVFGEYCKAAPGGTSFEDVAANGHRMDRRTWLRLCSDVGLLARDRLHREHALALHAWHARGGRHAALSFGQFCECMAQASVAAFTASADVPTTAVARARGETPGLPSMQPAEAVEAILRALTLHKPVRLRQRLQAWGMPSVGSPAAHRGARRTSGVVSRVGASHLPPVAAAGRVTSPTASGAAAVACRPDMGLARREQHLPAHTAAGRWKSDGAAGGQRHHQQHDRQGHEQQRERHPGAGAAGHAAGPVAEVDSARRELFREPPSLATTSGSTSTPGQHGEVAMAMHPQQSRGLRELMAGQAAAQRPAPSMVPSAGHGRGVALAKRAVGPVVASGVRRASQDRGGGSYAPPAGPVDTGSQAVHAAPARRFLPSYLRDEGVVSAAPARGGVSNHPARPPGSEGRHGLDDASAIGIPASGQLHNGWPPPRRAAAAVGSQPHHHRAAHGSDRVEARPLQYQHHQHLRKPVVAAGQRRVPPQRRPPQRSVESKLAGAGGKQPPRHAYGISRHSPSSSDPAQRSQKAPHHRLLDSSGARPTRSHVVGSSASSGVVAAGKSPTAASASPSGSSPQVANVAAIISPMQQFPVNVVSGPSSMESLAGFRVAAAAARGPRRRAKPQALQGLQPDRPGDGGYAAAHGGQGGAARWA